MYLVTDEDVITFFEDMAENGTPKKNGRAVFNQM